MKYEARPTFVDAMQWDGDPETLTTLLDWIMSTRQGEEFGASPMIIYTRRWGPHEGNQGEPTAELSGHRWTIHLHAGAWVVKDGPRVTYMSDQMFKDTYKQARSKR